MPSRSPIILLASPHAHLSRLALMLGRHPALYAPGELNLLAAPRLVDVFDRLPGARTHGLLRTLAQLHAGEQTLESIEMARRWIFRRALHDTSDVYRELCARVAPRRLIDASSLYTDPGQEESLARLRATWPEADYLHLVRHPLAQGLAWLRDPLALAQLHQLGSLDRAMPGPLPDPQIDWARRQRAILEFLRDIAPERQHQVRSEELFLEPRLVLARICAWLTLDWSETLLEAMLHPEHSPYACPGPYGAEGGLDADVIARPGAMPVDQSPLSLDQPPPWRPDGRGFKTEVLDLAHALGYA